MTKPVRLHGAEFHRSVYFHLIPEGVEYEDILKKDYWTHVAALLKPGDLIEIRGERDDYMAWIVVRASSSVDATVKEVYKVDLGSPEPATSHQSDYEVKWRGPKKWGVVRKSDGTIIAEDIGTKDEAYRELHDYERAIAA